jgi:hypothetical protein
VSAIEYAAEWTTRQLRGDAGMGGWANAELRRRRG